MEYFGVRLAIRLGTDGPRWLKCRDTREEKGWRTSSRTGGYVEFFGTVQAFQQGKKGKCRRLLLLADGFRRLVCEAVVMPPLCMYVCVRTQSRGQGPSLTDKGNGGRFDCVPSTCVHFPKLSLSGVFGKARGTEKVPRQGPAFACLCRTDVTSSSTQHTKFGAEQVGGACLLGGQCRNFRINSLPFDLALNYPALHCTALPRAVTRGFGSLCATA